MESFSIQLSLLEGEGNNEVLIQYNVVIACTVRLEQPSVGSGVTSAKAFQRVPCFSKCSKAAVASLTSSSALCNLISCTSSSFWTNHSWCVTSSSRRYLSSFCFFAMCSCTRDSLTIISSSCMMTSLCCMEQYSYTARTHWHKDSQALLTSRTNSGTNWGLWTILQSCSSLSSVTVDRSKYCNSWDMNKTALVPSQWNGIAVRTRPTSKHSRFQTSTRPSYASPIFCYSATFHTNLKEVHSCEEQFHTRPPRWIIKQQTNSIHDFHHSLRRIPVVAHLFQIRHIKTVKNLKAWKEHRFHLGDKSNTAKVPVVFFFCRLLVGRWSQASSQPEKIKHGWFTTRWFQRFWVIV